MTVNRLYARLGVLINDGHGRKPVVVDKSTFQHNCESDGVVILDLAGVGVERVLQSDGDGGTKENADGSESSRMCVVLVGDDAADDKGRILRWEDE